MTRRGLPPHVYPKGRKGYLYFVRGANALATLKRPLGLMEG